MIRPPRKMLAGAAITLGAATAIAVPAAFADSSASPGTSPSTPAAGSGTSPTSASTPADRQTDTLAAIKAKAQSAISLRLSALQAASTATQGNRFLTSSDRATILSTLSSDEAGLTALGPVIQADTTVAQARSDYDTIFTRYRVFALAIPQSRFAAAADDLTDTVVPRLGDAQQKLETLLAGKDSSKNTPAVQAAMNDLGNRIAGITSYASGLSATVLGYTPAQWNANHDLLSPLRSRLQDARADAKGARTDVRTVVQAIRS